MYNTSPLLLTYDTEFFHFHKPSLTYYADASDLDGLKFMPVYQDACDVGIALFSPATQRVVEFYISNYHRNADGDVTHWTLKPTPEAVRRLHEECPRLESVSVVIYND